METPPKDSAPDVDARDIPQESYVTGAVDLTPNSALVYISVPSSPVASGLMVYADFGKAVVDSWVNGLEGGSGRRLVGKEASPELCAGRRAFKALLDRWQKEGYTPDMGPELTHLGALYCSGRQPEFLGALPDDLSLALSLAFPSPDDPEEMEGVPPLDEIDVHNPEHLALLQERLERAAEF